MFFQQLIRNVAINFCKINAHCAALFVYVMTVYNIQEFLVGGGLAAPKAPPLAGGEDSGDEDDPRSKCGPPIAAPAEAKAKAPSAPPAPSTPPALPAPPVAPAKAPPVAPPSPPSPGFLVGGGASSSSSKAAATATAKGSAAKSTAKSKSKSKAKRRSKKDDCVPAIGGGLVYYDEYTPPFKIESYINWTLYCERPGCPADCQRTCGVISRNMKLLNSDLEPLALLHAWRDVDIDPEKGHRLTPVPDKKVIDFYEDHYDELSALRDLFMTP